MDIHILKEGKDETLCKPGTEKVTNGDAIAVGFVKDSDGDNVVPRLATKHGNWCQACAILFQSGRAEG